MDNTLIELVKNGSKEGFNKLYDTYAPPLYGFISRIVSNNQVAEEALEHCFLEVWNKIRTYNSSKEKLFIWMFKIARNSAKIASETNNKEIFSEEEKYGFNSKQTRSAKELGEIMELNPSD